MRHLAFVVVVAAAAALMTASMARADFRGLGLAKSCNATTPVFAAYTCNYKITNNLDANTPQDTYVVTAANFSDTVLAKDGNVGSPTSPEYFSEIAWVAINGATCTGGTGTGTTGDPYIGATSCTLPGAADPDLGPYARITSVPNSFYNVQPDDYTLASHQLFDTVAITGNDTTSNTTVSASTQGFTTVTLNPSSTTTSIEGGSTQAAGVSVSDDVTVHGVAGDPAPTGNVTVNFFNNGGCSSSAAATVTHALTGVSGSNATYNGALPEGPLAAGLYSYQANYLGDNAYAASPGACEPLQIVDANIQISPPTATNRVGSNHTLTCHINTNDGSGFTNAPDGTVCTVAIISGPGSPASQNCTVSGGAGNCSATISSSVTGTSTIQASTNVSVGGLGLKRATSDGLPGDGTNASKLWVDAAIVITPDATNEVGHPHTFTATLLFDTGSGLSPAGAGKGVTVTLTGSNGANPNPAGPFSLATSGAGQVQVTFTSATPGQVTGHASWTGSVSGSAPFTVQTDGTGNNSGDATKTFVDANIQITPATATDPINDNHTLHCHINVNKGLGAGYENAPDGTVCTVAIISGPGTPASQNCTMSSGNGTCDVTITSATAGTSTIQASTIVTVGGIMLSRTTGDSNVGDGANAQKIWVSPDANIQISPQTATDPTGDHHTLTGHVNVSNDGTTYTNAPDMTTINFVIISGPGSFVGGVSSCMTSGGTGSCTVQITSNVGGTTVIRAKTDITVNTVPLHRETMDGLTGDSPDANKTWVPPGGIIAPTQTSCSDILNGTFATLGQINYSVTGGNKIGQGINPGVFFFYTKITTTSPNQVVTVTESNTSTNGAALFSALNGQAWLWKGDCSSHTTGAPTGGGSGASFTVPTPGNYIIGIKYDTKSIAGTTAPVPSTITYNFVTSLGGTTGGSVLLKKQ